MVADRRVQIKRYFLPFPQWAMWVVGGGLFLALFFSPIHAYGLPLLLVAAGGWGLYGWYQRPSDEQMDIWLKEEIDPLIERALQKNSLESGETLREAIHFSAPVSGRELQGKCFSECRAGLDQKIRCTPIQVVVINFTQDQIAIYHVILDRTTGNFVRETASEYFYKDVVAVSMESHVETFDTVSTPMILHRYPALREHVIDGKLQLQGAQRFILLTTAGRSLEIPLTDPLVLTTIPKGQFVINEAEQAAMAIRRMLKDHKSAM